MNDNLEVIYMSKIENEKTELIDYCISGQIKSIKKDGIVKFFNRRLQLSIIFSFAFTVSSSQAVFTKDGVKLGDRSNFINSCIGGFDKDDIDLNGISVNKYKYCSCVCDNLIPEVTSDEILIAMKTDDLSSLFSKDQNLKIIMQCVDGNMKLEDDFVFK